MSPWNDHELAGPPIDRRRGSGCGTVALEAGLELLVAVVGQAHRPAVAVEGRQQRVERKRAVVLGAVADREARMQHQPLHAEAAGGQQARRSFRHFVRRLRRHDQVQYLLGSHRTSRCRCRVRTRRCRWTARRSRAPSPASRPADAPARPRSPRRAPWPARRSRRRAQACGQGGRACRRSRGKSGRVLRARRRRRRKASRRRRARSGSPPRSALKRSGDGAPADHVVVELQLLLGGAEAGEVVPDQHRNGLARDRPASCLPAAACPSP